LNVIAGQRATAGNYNEPWNIGFFLNDIPKQNRVRLVRADGTAIANARVRVFRSSGEVVTQNYAMVFDNIADFDMTTSNDGVIVFDRNPFSDNGIFVAVDRVNTVAIAEITDGGTTRWAFLDALLFNMAYWRGSIAVADYTIMADAPQCFDSAGGPASPAPEAVVSTADVTFSFPVISGHRYELNYMVDGSVRRVITTTSGSVKLTLPLGRIVWWTVDLDSAVGNCLPKYSPVYGFDHTAGTPAVRRRRAV
jgi:hypothetical protein